MATPYWLHLHHASSLAGAAELGRGPLPLHKITTDVYRMATGTDWLQQQTHKHKHTRS